MVLEPEAAPPAVEDRLVELARIANERHGNVLFAGMTMLYAGIAAGEALNEAKAQVPHGGWQAWCRENLTFGTTSACHYMLVARHRERLLAVDEVTTMQKALRYLQANKLTTQTRIDDERIAEIRAAAAVHGFSRAARLLDESFSTVRKYAQGHQKMTTEQRREAMLKRRGHAPVHARISITDPMIERMAVWLHDHFAPQPRKGVNDFWRGLAVDALGAAVREPGDNAGG